MKKRSGSGPLLPSTADKQHEGKTIFRESVKCLSLTRLCNAAQSKQLRKLIQQTFQQYATLKEDECMVKFFETLNDFVSYDEEVFRCELVVSSDLRRLPEPARTGF